MNELQTVIGLTEEENKLVLEKLNNFSKYDLNNFFSLCFYENIYFIFSVSKYHLEGFGSTTPELDNYNKQKRELEDVNNKMNKTINKMKNFMKENEELFKTIQNVS